MAQPASETANLVLKWKQEEQEDAFLATNRMRCSSTYRRTLQQGIGQTCIVYVPKNGVPKRPDLNAKFAAKGVLNHFEADPHDSKRIVLHLANLKPFPFPTPREMNGLLVENGEVFGRRDYSREQHVIRKIEASDLRLILYYGEAGTLIGLGSTFAARPRETEIEQDYTGLSDVDQHGNQDPIYIARMARIRSYRVRKHTLWMDQNRCILSNCQISFRGRPVALEVVHLWPLELGGWDVISNTAVMHVAIHPLYDRFAFTLTDDFDVLWARDADPELLTHGLHMTKRAHFLRAPTQMPDLTNIRRHREHFFKLEQSTSYGV